MKLVDFVVRDSNIKTSIRLLGYHLIQEQRTKLMEGTPPVIDVRMIRYANIDSDHYLVTVKVRTRMSKEKNVTKKAQRQLDVGKLQLPEMPT